MSDLNDRVAALEARIAASTKDVIVLRNAVANLSTRIDDVEKKGGVKKSSTSAARSTPAHARRVSNTSATSTNGSSSSSSSTPAKATHTRPTSATPSSASASTRRTPSSVGAPKIFQARTPGSKSSDDIKSTATGLDPARKGIYALGNRKIPVYYPSDVDNDEKNRPAPKAPNADLQLEFVYGFNGKAARNNLFYVRDQPHHLLYSLAGTGVVYNVDANTQTFFTGHNEDILCVAYHPSRPLAATGQLDPKGRGTPYTCIWDVNTGALVNKITFHDHGVTCVAFSPCGKYLVTIGDEDSHIMAWWDWENHKDASDSKKKKAKDAAEPVLDTMTAKDKIYGVYFSPIGDETKGYELVTVGSKHIKYWKVDNITASDKKARSITGRIPPNSTETKLVQKSFQSVAWMDDGSYVVGTATGHLYLFKGDKFVKFWAAHDNEAAVGALVRVKDGYASAGEDSKVLLWNGEHNKIGEFNLSTVGSGGLHGRSISYSPDRNSVAVGTKQNDIIEIDLGSGALNRLVQGHSSEVWGLAIHPTEPIAISTAHDKQIRFWDTKTRRAIDDRTIELKSKARSADISSDGKVLVIGCFDGTVAAYEFATGNNIWSVKPANETVDAVAFSADNALVGAGSWDQAIYILDAATGKTKATMKGHTSSVLMINFSKDGRYLMSNSRDYESLFWDVSTGKRANVTEEICNLEWHGWNCFLGWAVQGIWAGCNDGTDINMVARSHNSTLLAAGDDFGSVRLYAYPCHSKAAPVKEYPGHSSHVMNVRWSPNDDYLFSAGGADCGVFQWKVVSA